MDTACVSIFFLAISHLLDGNGAFAGLTLDDLLGSDAGLAHLCVADDQLHEFRMVDRVIEK